MGQVETTNHFIGRGWTSAGRNGNRETLNVQTAEIFHGCVCYLVIRSQQGTIEVESDHAIPRCYFLLCLTFRACFLGAVRACVVVRNAAAKWFGVVASDGDCRLHGL